MEPLSLISVIVPTYNRAEHLTVAASSVLNQTYADLELIIVDDGSTDETREVSEQLCHLDSRVRYLYQDNCGPSAARNRGIAAAQGIFVAFLDSDDRWEPTKLTKQLVLAESDAAIGVVYCDWEYINSSGEVSPGVDPPNVGLPTVYESLLYYNLIQAPSVALVRAACFDRVGLFDEALHWAEDWDMWLRIAKCYRFAKIPEPLVYLLQHMEQSQRNTAGMADAYLALVDKISVTIDVQHKHHLARVRWHNQLFAAEQYCATSSHLKAWATVALAVRSWPQGLVSPRTWYVLVLSLAGPLYPQANAVGVGLRQWCRHYLKMDSVTGWRGHTQAQDKSSAFQNRRS